MQITPDICVNSYLIQCDWVHSVVLRWERDNDVQLYGAPSSPKNSSEPITYMNGVPRYVHWSPSNDACGDPGTYYQVTGPQGIPVCSHVPGNITSCDVSGLIANVSHIDVWTVNCVGKSSPLRIPIPSWHATTSHPLPPSSTPGGSSSGQQHRTSIICTMLMVVMAAGAVMSSVL